MGKQGKNGEKKNLQPNIYLGQAYKRANKVHAGLIGDA